MTPINVQTNDSSYTLELNCNSEKPLLNSIEKKIYDLTISEETKTHYENLRNEFKKRFQKESECLICNNTVLELIEENPKTQLYGHFHKNNFHFICEKDTKKIKEDDLENKSSSFQYCLVCSNSLGSDWKKTFTSDKLGIIRDVNQKDPLSSDEDTNDAITSTIQEITCIAHDCILLVSSLHFAIENEGVPTRMNKEVNPLSFAESWKSTFHVATIQILFFGSIITALALFKAISEGCKVPLEESPKTVKETFKKTLIKVRETLKVTETSTLHPVVPLILMLATCQFIFFPRR